MRAFKFIIFAFFALFITLGGSACRTKSGCPANADMSPKTNKRGQIVGKKQKASHGLFPKDVKKKVGVKG